MVRSKQSIARRIMSAVDRQMDVQLYYSLAWYQRKAAIEARVARRLKRVADKRKGGIKFA